ncbi:DUF6069 family protein [Microbacterium sp. I2]|uniref:DUF6069 family protein n=1 Tax=Microbacterium sp. I2 TaxID=3391826 RepID=UPI003ED8D535
MSTTLPRTYSPTVAVPLSIAIVAVLASAVNSVLALVGSAVGATGPGLQPIAYLSLTVVAAIGGAVGWHLIDRFAKRPRRVMRWLVPSFLAVSFVPDILIGVTTGTGDGWLYAAVLMSMHVITITIAILTYRRLMPLSDREDARDTTA